MLSFRKYVVGVVTHGFEPLGGFDLGYAGWVDVMADSLGAAGYDLVFPFHWEEDSKAAVPDFAISKGIELAHQIETLVQSKSLPGPVDLHLIGHSRGAVVINEAVYTLQLDKLRRGYTKLTMLDPHPAHNHLLPWPWFSGIPYPIPGWKVSAFLALGTMLFQARAQDPEIKVPAMVDEAEVYYQNTPSLLTPNLPTDASDALSETFELFLNLWGEVPVETAVSGFRVAYHDLTGLGMGHTDVHEWYQARLDGTLGGGGGGGRSALEAVTDSVPAAMHLSSGAIDTSGSVDGEAGAAGYAMQELPDPEVGALYPALVDDLALAERLVACLGGAMTAYQDGTLRIAMEELTTFLELVEAQQGIHIAPEAAAVFSYFGDLIMDDFRATADRSLPVIAEIDDCAVDEGTLLSLSVTATDPSPADTLTFSLDAAPAGMSIDPVSGLMSWAPQDGPATVAVTVRVTDNSTPPLSDIRTFVVTVHNVAPAPTLTGPTSGVRGQPLTFTGSFIDPGADTWTATVDFGDGTGPQDLALLADKTFTVTHVYAAERATPYSIAVQVMDDDGGEGTASWNVAVGMAEVQDGTLFVGGTDGRDKIDLHKGKQPDTVQVTINDKDDKIKFRQDFGPGILRVVVFGQGGNDDIKVHDDLPALLTELYGGDGDDRLEAGRGDAYLYGGAGNDKLKGGKGRNVLIGGMDQDDVEGGQAADILIGGDYLSASDRAAVVAIMSEWANGTASRLNSSTLIDDGVEDRLKGKKGVDWFFLQYADTQKPRREDVVIEG